MRSSYWPFSRRAAFFTSIVLLPASVMAVLWPASQEITGFEFSIWILIVAVLVGLLPVILVVLGGVGSVEAGGVKIAFAAVQEVVTKSSDVDTRALLAYNLGQPPGQVQDSASDTVIETLSAAVGNDFVVLDLQEGEAWWETRLLLLVTGATRLHNPKAVAFTSATPDRARTFIGWAKPVDIQRRLLDTHEAFRIAYQRAERDTLIHKLSVKDTPDEVRMTPWAPAGKAKEFLAEKATKPTIGVQQENGNMWEYPWPSHNASLQRLRRAPARRSPAACDC